MALKRILHSITSYFCSFLIILQFLFTSLSVAFKISPVAAVIVQQSKRPVWSVQAPYFHPSLYDSAPPSCLCSTQSHSPFIFKEHLTSAWLCRPVAAFLLNHQSARRASLSVWAATPLPPASSSIQVGLASGCHKAARLLRIQSREDIGWIPTLYQKGVQQNGTKRFQNSYMCSERSLTK